MDPFTAILVNIAIAVIAMAASYAITATMTKRQPAQPPAALEDFDFPQFDEGTPQAVVFGDCWSDGWMVLWFGDYRVEPIKKKGGKK